MARCMGALSGSRVPQAFSGWSAFMAARITHCMLSSHVYGPFDPRDVEAAFVDPRPTGTARPDSAGTTALFRRELLGSYVAIGVTLLAIGGFVVEGGVRLTSLAGAADWASASELVIGRGLLGFFIFSGLVYHFTRLGYLIRFSAHRAAPDSELERVYRRTRAPRVTILVPSYKEEPRVVRQTLLAAALQQYPRRRIVLLIDDPPAPGNREDAARLETARTLPRELEALFAEPCRRFERALAGYIVRRANGWVDPRQEVERLAAALREAADWLDGLADATAVRDHTDALFVERILRAPARAHRVRASTLQTRQDPARADLLLEYRRLATLFKVEITSFERKRYANLSHEPNKAMNVNAYLALMGKGFREAASRDGCVLEGTSDAQATLRVPDAGFIVVLDADSLILAEYTLRLVHFVTRPGNERVAVVQTPYASVPGAASTIERIAGATTDVQLMTHQGATLFGAGSWVGASALVRRAALDDIVFTTEERGYSIPCYVRDRTLNEDTDTTVDLIRRGWTVQNYPDRLAYSATPPDFGSLLIQRRRWATGGLIILPKLARYVVVRPSFRRVWEGLIRAQYILSAPLGSIGALVLALYPFMPRTAWSDWAALAFLAYLVAYARDLVHNGNRGSDLFRAMSLNAMLLPVNLAGAVNSIRQLCTGRKIPFQRTPKVDGRTAATPLHVAVQLALFLLACSEAPLRLVAGEWLAGLLFLTWAVALGYALHAFIGWRAALEDLFAGVEPRRLLLSRAILDGSFAPQLEADP